MRVIYWHRCNLQLDNSRKFVRKCSAFLGGVNAAQLGWAADTNRKHNRTFHETEPSKPTKNLPKKQHIYARTYTISHSYTRTYLPTHTHTHSLTYTHRLAHCSLYTSKKCIYWKAVRSCNARIYTLKEIRVAHSSVGGKKGNQR